MIFPLGAMACVAGVARMRPVGFFITASIGIVVRLSFYAWLAESIRGPILTLLEVIRSYQAPATGVLIVCVAAYQFSKWRRRESAGESTG